MNSKKATFCIAGLIIGAILGFLLRPSSTWVRPVDIGSFLLIIISFGAKCTGPFCWELAQKTLSTFYACLIGGGAVGFGAGYFADLLSGKNTTK